MKYGAALRREMLAAGLTPKELARAAEIPLASLMAFFRGYCKPNAAVSIRLNEALGTDVGGGTSKTGREEATGRILPADAAALLGIDAQTVRVGIRHGLFAWGRATRVSGSRYTYVIDAAALLEYKEQIDTVRGRRNEREN